MFTVFIQVIVSTNMEEMYTIMILGKRQVKYFSFLFIFFVIKNFSEEMARVTSELIRRFCLFSFKRRSSSSSPTSTSDNSESEEEKKVGT